MTFFFIPFYLVTVASFLFSYFALRMHSTFRVGINQSHIPFRLRHMLIKNITA